MKFFHISDLHIGKQLHLYDLSEVQRDVLRQIVCAAQIKRPDAILIAGDIYDKSVPSGEAFRIFDEFLNALGDIQPMIPVIIISGNHDHPSRLNFASSFLEKHHIYISTALPQTPQEHIRKVVLTDEYGSVNVYMLPFTRPADARNLFGDSAGIRTYDDAVGAIMERECVDDAQRNVLVAHQFFVSGEVQPEKRESEMSVLSVGGIDSVAIRHVEKFDYVALGHMHTSQSIGKPHIRYSGTPLKYSVSEADDQKSITVVTLGEKGTEPKIEFIPLTMKPDVRKLRGSYEQIKGMSDEDTKDDYVSIVLTDDEALYMPQERLREFYSRILEIRVDNTRTAALLRNDLISESANEDPLTLFCDFYQEMNGQPISDREKAVIKAAIEQVSEREMNGE